MARRPRKYTMAQRLRDPAKRSKLPLSALSPVQQRQRRVNQRITRENANPLYDPTAPLSGHSLISAARQIGGAELDPQIAAVGRQSATTTTQGNALAGRAKDYYSQLAGQEAERHARLQAINQLASKQIAGVGAQSREQFDRQDTAEAQRQQADVLQRGTGLQDSAGQLAELAAARGRSATLQQSSESAAAALGANWEALNTTLGHATQMRGGEVQGELANRQSNALAELAAKRADLEGQKGSATTKALLDLRNTEFENRATMEGLGIKRDDLTQQAQIQTANRRVKYAGIRATKTQKRLDRAAAKARAGERITQQERSSLRSAGIDPDKGTPIPGGKLDPNRPQKQKNETAGSLKMRRDISAARGTWRRLMTKFRGDERHVKKHMIEVMGVPPAAYNAVYDLERHGTLHPNNVQALQDDLGVQVPAGWRHRRKGK